MEDINKDEQEYIKFMEKLVNKVNEITQEYNKLSDKNKHRFQVLVEEIIRINTVLRIR